MSAKNGLAVSFRTRGRLIGFCAVLALVISGLVGASAASAETSNYVASGDSISFGYTAEVFNINFPNESPNYFNEGFDVGFTKDLNKATEVGKTVVDLNLACPGETSNGFIGENPALGGEASTEPNGGEELFNARHESEGKVQGLKDWHPCAYRTADGLPLHDSLSEPGEPPRPLSQLEEILSILKEGHPTHPVRAITINIGSNDELAAIATCKHEVTVEFETEGKSKYGGPGPEEAVKGCLEFSAIHSTIPHIAHNLGDILGVIDSTSPGGGHYTGAIVVLGFYNPDALVLPGSDALQIGVNRTIEKEVMPLFPNASYANPFPVFNKGFPEPVKEQESICKDTEMCNPNVQTPGGKPEGKDGDIHPSRKEHPQLNEAKETVTAKGGGYNALATLVNKSWLANPAK
jgi:hypothetical protein